MELKQLERVFFIKLFDYSARIYVVWKGRQSRLWRVCADSHFVAEGRCSLFCCAQFREELCALEFVNRWMTGFTSVSACASRLSRLATAFQNPLRFALSWSLHAKIWKGLERYCNYLIRLAVLSCACEHISGHAESVCLSWADVHLRGNVSMKNSSWAFWTTRSTTATWLIRRVCMCVCVCFSWGNLVL